MSKSLILALIAAVFALGSVFTMGPLSIWFLIGALFCSGLSLVIRFWAAVNQSYIPGMDKH